MNWAIAVKSDYYLNSIKKGEDNLVKVIQGIVAGACGSNAKIVLAGYSQVVGDVFENQLSPAVVSHVVGLAMVADPKFVGRALPQTSTAGRSIVASTASRANFIGIQRSVAVAEAPKALSLCMFQDPVCNYTKSNLALHLGNHFRYPTQSFSSGVTYT